MSFTVRYTGGSEEHPDIVAAPRAAKLLVLCGAKCVQVFRGDVAMTLEHKQRAAPTACRWIFPHDHEDLGDLPS
jgi:hypothetical protein